MSTQTPPLPKEIVTISITAVLRRNRNSGTVFSGKDDCGRHMRIVAPYHATSRTPGLGEVWEAHGEFGVHPEYGLQFYAERCERLLPKGQLIVLYLANNPKFKGIGLSKASRLYARFGEELTQLLSKGDPTVFEGKELLTPLTARTLVAAWHSDQVESDIIAFLDKYNFNIRLASKVQRCWGEKAIDILTRNPYCMLAFAGWEVVDNAARNLGITYLDERRLIGAVETCLYNRLNNKHTLTTSSILLQHIRSLLGVDTDIATCAVNFALADNAIVGTEQHGYQPIGVASIETGIAKRLMCIHNGELPRQGHLLHSWSGISSKLIDDKIAAHETAHKVTLNEEQRSAIRSAVKNRISVLTGGAGVGKTTVLRVIIAVVEESNGTIYQMALAGRAAQRMKEATGHEAMTIAGFISNVRNGHLQVKSNAYVIIDESSMLDQPTMYRILRYLPDGVRVLLVGDPYQLPPIGFGLVFHKLALSNIIPRIELKHVHRQAESTGIPAVALSIRNGSLPRLKAFRGNDTGVSFIDCAPRNIVSSLHHVTTEWDELSESQILGVTKAGIAGVRVINEYYHSSKSVGKRQLWRFAVGDPVIYLENDYERLLFNGTLGQVNNVVTDEDGPALACDFDGVTHLIKEPDLDKIDLAYGITVHKAQGSQFNRVAVPIMGSRLLDRTLIYTALTRGVKQVVFVGDRRAFDAAIINLPSAMRRNVGFSI
jgi:exodeoxyribonuclease V alpha subunit